MGCDGFTGNANKRVTIQKRTDTVDNYGGSSVAWTTLQEAWAIIEPQSGREVFSQGQDQGRVDSKVTIRYISTLKSAATAGKYRILFDSRYFPIIYVKNLDEDMKREGKAFQVLYCQENAPEND